MSTPYFSVLVAAYNVDKYLDECLTSLIQQTYLDAEFIVVDDASTDNTKQICEGFAQRDVRFKLVRNEKNEGLLAVRKKAVKMARGQFVVFLDGDDCLASTEALSQLVECTKEHQADIYRFTVRSFGEDEKECEAFSRWLNKKGLDRSCSLEILRDCYLSFYRSWTLWASCYRTDVLKRAYSEVVDERYTCNEDGYASFLIAYFANSYKVCDTSPIYAYRVGSGLTSGGVTCEKFIRNLEISKCLE